MRVRGATLEDRARWDAFVDSEGGTFYHYFDWKCLHEERGGRFIPLMIESDSSQLVGILPMVRNDRQLYSVIGSGRVSGVDGLLLAAGLLDSERGEAITALLRHVDAHHSQRCSTFTLAETLPPGANLSEEPTADLVQNGFRFRYDRTSRLPCNFVLELKQPFADNVWKKFSGKTRQLATKAARSGVKVIEDREFSYAGVFTEMLEENHRWHGSKVPTRGEIDVWLDAFRDRSKLFVALLDGEPLLTGLCYYTSSTCYLAKMGTRQRDTDNVGILLYKSILEGACNAGYRYADFGKCDTVGLASFKDRFGGTRVPVRVYEKRASVARYIAEKAPILLSSAWHDRSYLWKNRRMVWDRVVHM